MPKDFYSAVLERRSIYAISKETTISDERIQEILEQIIMNAPTAFNSQSARVVLLLGENHNKLWDITMEALRRIVPPNKFDNTEERINSFKEGYGTILYFEDISVVKSLQEKFQKYKDNFPKWSQQSSGMLQFAIWTALEAEGLGASLQHYNEVIEDEVKTHWNIPDHWMLIAQMPFGKPKAAAGEKEYMPLEDRLKILK